MLRSVCVPKVLVDASQTIAEIIREHEETRSVFLRHGLALDEIGSTTLAEVAAEHGLNSAALERELVHAIEESEPFDHGGFEWEAGAGVVRVSSSLAAMLEMTELSGPPSAFLARVHPDDREQVLALFRDARERPHPFAFEYRVVHTDGSTRIYASQVEPIADASRFIGMCWDITEQHPSCVFDPGPLLRNTLEATADGILVVDRASNITSYNQRFVALWGIPREVVATGHDEAMLRYVLDQLDEPEQFLAGVNALYASPERESFDVLRFKDGRVFERYSRPQRVAFAIVGRVWSFRDVTERERLLRAKSLLADASRLLASLDVHSALDAVVRIGVPQLGAACAIELFGDPRLVVSHADGPARAWPPWPPEVLAGHPAMYDRDGVSQLAVPLRVQDEVVGAVAFAASPDRRHTRADLELAERLASAIALSIENARLYDHAQQALRAREEFLSIAAHELRGPLSAMNLAVQTLRRRDVPDPTRDRMLSLIEREGRRLTRFAQDITDITRIRAGTLGFADTEVDLVQIVREVVARLAPDVERSGSTVSVDAAAPVIGSWDRVRIDQVVTNLVINALKFGLGRPIELSIAASGGWGTLEVSDHGLGVRASQREVIFHPFERAVPVRHYGGLGLGLFIVRTIVTRYGGTVHVEPRDNGGSRFVVRLPQGAG
jgi:signal transduction histidine kinase